jgi:hypothetical protein
MGKCLNGGRMSEDVTPPSSSSSPPIIVLVKDLMFLSRIGNTAQTLGIPIRSLRDPAKLASEKGCRCIVDLNLEGALDAAVAWKQATGKQVLGFVSHVDTETINRAKSLGVDSVLARSAFVQSLPAILKC